MRTAARPSLAPTCAFRPLPATRRSGGRFEPMLGAANQNDRDSRASARTDESETYVRVRQARREVFT